ncbi:FAD-binding domain-containing protein [Trametes versicolor FP-101664 SS1]|uniref:FAD-binding domain-containing protein n=1 Tax=Trametes versicolor (strain FP-101664) TaxID=717944 RepID=UPI0004624784|nr:FAD-binding domain-containing protein [Trametes versicolor FP-101664 SS1]EIW53385.1 FAD-binding domain-containing protein [Trametes versicolor FP-101664 SS1]
MGVYASHLPPAAATYPAAPLSVLNATLGGRVHAAVPFARPCFSLASPGVLGHPDTAACAHVIETYGDRHAITSQFGAYLNSGGTICQATGQQCLLDSNAPNDTRAFFAPNKCEQGNLPSYYIDVRSAADVSAAFDFSRRTGVPLSVKNTGHDFLSRSAGADSLSLWMHNFQDMSFSPSFVPSGCKKAGVAAVTFGTGVLTRTLNEFADAHNVTIPGGADDSIAYGGGYVMGGGHSAFANAFGLAVDRVLQFEAVTPDGVHRVANACTEPDLFFALRGGGGSTFAVVLRVTMLGLPQLDSPVVVTAFKQKPSVEMQAKYIEFLVNNAFQLSSKGWGGYIAPNLGLTFVNPFISMDEAAEAMGDLRQLVESELNSTFLLQRETSYLSFYNQFVVPTTLPDDTPSALASRLIPASVFNSTSSRAALSDALVAGAQRHTVTLLFAVAPYFFKGNDGLTSVTPAWREAIWHVIYIDYWAYNTTVSERTQIYQGLEDSMGVLRQIAPNSGVYRNEASVFEPDYAEAFWGPNYERLLAIKRKYDPDHLLDCWKCVGWKGASDARYKCQQRLDE